MYVSFSELIQLFMLICEVIYIALYALNTFKGNKK